MKTATEEFIVIFDSLKLTKITGKNKILAFRGKDRSWKQARARRQWLSATYKRNAPDSQNWFNQTLSYKCLQFKNDYL